MKTVLTLEEKQKLEAIIIDAEKLLGRAKSALKYPQDYNTALVLMRDDLSSLTDELGVSTPEEEEAVWSRIAGVRSREM